METHLEERPARGGFDFGDRPSSSRVLTICGVTCDRTSVVTVDPTCSWCARKQADKDEARRLERIAWERPK
jgi:hypothetical protein